MFANDIVDEQQVQFGCIFHANPVQNECDNTRGSAFSLYRAKLFNIAEFQRFRIQTHINDDSSCLSFALDLHELCMSGICDTCSVGIGFFFIFFLKLSLIPKGKGGLLKVQIVKGKF